MSQGSTQRTGLYAGWGLGFRPELKPNKINDDEVNNKKPDRYSSAGTDDDSEQKMRICVSSQHSSKPHVICR